MLTECRVRHVREKSRRGAEPLCRHDDRNMLYLWVTRLGLAVSVKYRRDDGGFFPIILNQRAVKDAIWRTPSEGIPLT